MPVLLVQPLPVQPGARDRVLQAAARRDAHGRRAGLRLRVDVRGRRHAHRRHRRARRHDRPGQGALLDQGGLLGDQPQPPLPAVDRAARRAASTASAWACRASTTTCSSRWTATTSTARRQQILERLHSIEGALPLAQRRHDLQLPQPDRRDARARHRAGQEHRREPDDVLPADGLAGGRGVAQAHGGRGRLRTRGPLLPQIVATACPRPSRPRARGRSRAPAAA